MEIQTARLYSNVQLLNLKREEKKLNNDETEQHLHPFLECPWDPVDRCHPSDLSVPGKRQIKRWETHRGGKGGIKEPQINRQVLPPFLKPFTLNATASPQLAGSACGGKKRLKSMSRFLKNKTKKSADHTDTHTTGAKQNTTATSQPSKTTSNKKHTHTHKHHLSGCMHNVDVVKSYSSITGLTPAVRTLLTHQWNKHMKRIIE